MITNSIQLQYLQALLTIHLDRARSEERGASAVEWVVITALVVGIALGVGVILSRLIKDKANSIDLTTP